MYVRDVTNVVQGRYVLLHSPHIHNRMFYREFEPAAVSIIAEALEENEAEYLFSCTELAAPAQ